MWEEPAYEIIDTGLEVTAYLSTDETAEPKAELAEPETEAAG